MRRTWALPLVALALLSLAALTCNRSAQSQPTLIPSRAPLVTASATSSALLSPTPTPAPTVTATSTPTSTPTPTPLPEVVIMRAQGALDNGDPAAARSLYEALPVDHLEESDAATTRYGLAVSLLEDEDYAQAVTVLEEFLARHPEHPLVSRVHFLLAEALVRSGDFERGIEQYRAYLDQQDVIAPYVQMWIGDAYAQAGMYEEAVAAYEKSLAAAPTMEMIYQLREKMGLVYAYSGEYDAAVDQYDAILAASEDANLRARIQYQASQALLTAGQRPAAYERMYDLVDNYYKTSPAYDALVDLVNSGQSVNEFQRGLVDYYNEAYDAAIAAFYRYIEADLQGHEGAPHYFAGMAYQDTGNYAGAVLEFDKLIDTHPGDPYVDDAWLAKAWTRYLADDDETAVQIYTRFVDQNPLDALASEALWWAGNIRFWVDDCAQAAPLFARLAADYPASEYASEALYRAAFCRYRLGGYAEAVVDWERYAADYPAAELVAGAHFWRGRAYLATGESVSATLAFSESVKAGPLDYYSQRALDYLVGDAVGAARAPFELLPARFDSRSTQADADRAVADLWVADALGLSNTEAVTLSQLSPVLAADPRLLRGEALWHLGRKEESKNELEWLRRDTSTDLRAQYQLAIFFRDLGLYRSSILAANAALLLSPAHSPFDAPSYLARLAYPAYYQDLVLAESTANDLDPLLVFSLIRQESLFEGFATSFAYAHGLMQIIPSTGQSVARSLSWPNYDTSDLYRPYISVKFGAWYLARQLDTFDGRVYPALAAYNGGPGNSRGWLERAMVCPETTQQSGSQECSFDPDIFVEIIHLRETRLYIRQIYKHFAVYQFLYGDKSPRERNGGGSQ